MRVAPLGQIVEDRGDRLAIERERARLQARVAHRRRPDDRLLRRMQIERRKTKAGVENLRNVLGRLLEKAQIVFAQGQHDPHRGRVLAQLLGGRRRGRRPHPAGEVTQLIEKMRPRLLALKREQLLELIEHQDRREQQVAPPELGGLEEAPERVRQPRHIFDALSCCLAGYGLEDARKRAAAQVVDPDEQRQVDPLRAAAALPRLAATTSCRGPSAHRRSPCG